MGSRFLRSLLVTEGKITFFEFSYLIYFEMWYLDTLEIIQKASNKDKIVLLLVLLFHHRTKIIYPEK